MQQRIGIYAGTFDPIHAGHVSFAKAALTEAHLESVYFLPERHPRAKPSATSYSKRLASLQHDLRNNPGLEILDLADTAFSVQETLPQLQHRFPAAQLSLLVGADVLEHMPKWPGIDELLSTCELIVGVREGYGAQVIESALDKLNLSRARVSIVETSFAHLSSGKIRQQR